MTMTETSLDDFVESKWGPGRRQKQGDGSWLVSCPVPDHGKGLGDRTPSLHLSEGEGGRLLWKCMGKCDSQAVQIALGVSAAVRVGAGGTPSLSGAEGAPGVGDSRCLPPYPPVPPAEAALRAWAYQTLLDGLDLWGPDCEALKARGLPEEAVRMNGYRSLGGLTEEGVSRLRSALTSRFGREWERVPGLRGDGRTFLAARSGLLVPYRSPSGDILGFQVRQDAEPRYKWFGRKIKSSATPHVPLACRLLPRSTVRITEGALKADVVMALSAVREGVDLLTTVGVAGVDNWRAALPLLREWGTRTVRLAFDQDGPGRKVATSAAKALTGAGYLVEVEVWDGTEGKGLDDALLAGAEVSLAEPYSGVRHVAAFVEEKPLEWLWEGWVPLGMLTVLDGDPGVAKSTLTYRLAAGVTRGDSELSSGAAGNVLVLNAEDDPARVMVPRLRVAGADLSRVIFLEGQQGDEGVEPVALPGDTGFLRYEIARCQARLVIIDPVMSFLDASTDSYKDQSVRAALSRLHKLAEDMRCAVVLVRHLNKNGQQKGVYRGMGSVGFGGLARSCILMGFHPDDPEGKPSMRRVVGVYKSNHGGFPCREMSLRLDNGIITADLGDACDFSVFDVLNAQRTSRKDRWLEVHKKIVDKSLRAAGRVPVLHKAKWAAQLGLKTEELRAALEALGWAEPVTDALGVAYYEPREVPCGEKPA